MTKPKPECEVPVYCSYDKIVPISEVTPYPDNENKHPKEQIELLAHIIQNNGWRNAIVISKLSKMVSKGHARLLAAIKNGFNFVPVDYQDYQSEAHEHADRIADNKIAELSSIKDKSITALIEKIEQLDEHFDLKLLGIPNIDELRPIDQSGLVDDDFVPEAPEKAITQPDDLWILGNHKLLCGDSTKKESYSRLINGASVGMIFTSPPYNANTKMVMKDSKSDVPLYEDFDDNKDEGEYIEFCQSVLSNCFLILDGFMFWNVNYNSNSRSAFLKQISPFLDKLVETICWKKTALPVPYGLTRCWENIFVFSSLDKKQRVGTAYKTNFNFWEVSNIGALHEKHRAAFPVKLPIKAMELVKSEVVFDPFLGSGSTLIACEKLQRNCYGIEISPMYCDVIISRWEQFTGQKAVLED